MRREWPGGAAQARSVLESACSSHIQDTEPWKEAKHIAPRAAVQATDCVRLTSPKCMSSFAAPEAGVRILYTFFAPPGTA